MDHTRTRRYLKDFQFKKLFREELGWDTYNTPLPVDVDGQQVSLQPIAQKRGVVAFVCPSAAEIPPYATRRKIERKVAKSHRQHFIVYTDGGQAQQIWQWVRQEPGKPLASREHRYDAGHQSGESLLQKLQHIEFSLAEEEGLTHVDVTGRLRAAFDVERTTKRFYDQFKKERDAFHKFLKGIPDGDLARWYVSVMLNRLMFIYFIQRKGFLDGNNDYLRHKLAESRKAGPDRYYRHFLCPLFFEGFALPEARRSADARRLLGQVPYLNGGIFQRHQVEQLHGQDIQLPDRVFERLFDFFDQYQWHLDDRPLRDDSEINPDVLGYIFEKYVNQKQMGAYYTKEDITEYIGKNTIIPFLFDDAARRYPPSYRSDGSVWKLLAEDPDRYIYPAVRHGFLDESGNLIDLPPEIAAGIDDVSRRTLWNTPTDEAFALPTEIWRETVARRQRYEELWLKLAGGEVQAINDLITLNLDIIQFAQDVVENCEDVETLRAFWKAILEATILDPTCGSGAFLFAALNILEPLYEACLARMEAFLAELPADAHPQKLSDFKQVLSQVERHPGRSYFVFKTIVVNNLYGVDIMAEAVEIAKLRLFLKLVSQVERVEDVEPLPDIDFNIRAGNTLVGFARREDVERAIRNQTVAGGAQQVRLMFEEDQEILARIEEKAGDVDRLFQRFREMQTAHDQREYSQDYAETKATLQKRLAALDDELDRYLAREYGVDPDKSGYNTWRTSHQPFHWFVEFYGIMRAGGFNVVIGNPPYLELRQIDYRLINYSIPAPVHSVCVERSLQLLKQNGAISMILPMAIVSTQRMEVLQALLEKYRSVWYSNFAWRPSKLFDTVNRALTIFVATTSPTLRTYSTGYQKWIADTRDLLMPTIQFTEIHRERPYYFAPKLGFRVEAGLLSELLKIETDLGHFVGGRRNPIYYRTTGGLYWKVFTDFPPAFSVNGQKGHSSRETTFFLIDDRTVHSTVAALSSGLFWWWYTISSNLRDLNPSDIHGFPIPKSALYDPSLVRLGKTYLDDIRLNSTMLVRVQRQTGTTETQSFRIKMSKSIIDQIDSILAAHYGFSDEQLDFIINYDIKYRMGNELFNDDED